MSKRIDDFFNKKKKRLNDLHEEKSKILDEAKNNPSIFIGNKGIEKLKQDIKIIDDLIDGVMKEIDDFTQRETREQLKKIEDLNYSIAEKKIGINMLNKLIKKYN